MKFKDRRHAGRVLAAELRPYAGEDTLVLALPRGGVPVGFEVAEALDAPLDVFVVRKLGAPGNPEFGIGAVAWHGECVIDEGTVDALRITEDELDGIIEREREEIRRRSRTYRGDKPFPDVTGRTVLLVDDGIATGSTMRAAVTALKAMDVGTLVMGVPVGPKDSLNAIAPYVDDVVVVSTPEPFYAVGMWYETFDQTSDDEVTHLLESAQGFGRERAREPEVEG